MTGPQPDVVCFGMITPATVLVVDEFPEHNTGVAWRERADFISDDAAIIAVLLKQWGVRTGLIGTALGDDSAGRDRFARERAHLLVGVFFDLGHLVVLFSRRPDSIGLVGSSAGRWRRNRGR
ncbi:MAG: hypothetical protein IIC21_11875 [Chloroflexi bacterium]|nr:hypothetical protein [Chloroflexota bacterium]